MKILFLMFIFLTCSTSVQAFDKEGCENRIAENSLERFNYNLEYGDNVNRLNDYNEPDRMRINALSGKRNKIQGREFFVESITSYFHERNDIKINFTYDDEGNTLTELFQNADSSGNWLSEQLREYTYDERGNMLVEVVKKWLIDEPINFMKIINEYDLDDNLLSYTKQSWDGENWRTTDRTTYSYNLNGDLDSLLQEFYDNGEWYNWQMEIFTYDNDGNLILELTKRWRPDEWSNSTRVTYTYDENNNNLDKLTENWKDSVWVNHQRELHTYDENSQVLSRIYSTTWANDAWSHQKRWYYTYDSDENMITEETADWKNNDWENDMLTANAYDSFGNKTTMLIKTWSDDDWINKWNYTYQYNDNYNIAYWLKKTYTDNEWVDGNRAYYTYDANDNLILVKFEEWVDEQWKDDDRGFVLIPNSRGFDYPVNGYKIEVEYVEIVSVYESGLQEAGILTYPNPFSTNTTLEFYNNRCRVISLSLYDLTGKPVKEVLNNVMYDEGLIKVVMNSKNMEQGIYFYKLELGEQIFSGKIILIK